jgi:hypothetical protein
MLVMVAATVQAATIDVEFPARDQIATVTVEGTLSADDAEKFQEKTSALPKAVVVLRSDGGNVLEAIKIGETIGRKGFFSLVAKDCASACALAWLGGTQRFMAAGAQIGFHAAFNAQSGRETGVGNALIGAYLTRIGLPYEAVAYITIAPPNSMTWLTVAEAKQYGIELTLLDVPDSFYVTQALARQKETETAEGTAVARFAARSPRPDASPPNRPPELKPSERWAVIASRGELQDAILIAQQYKRDFPTTLVLRSGNGQFGVTVGPIDVQQNPSLLAQLVDSKKIPKDSYLSSGTRFVAVAWPN